MTDYILVPMEPTADMVEAARENHEGEPYLPVSLYKAMIAAAPAVQGEPVAYAVFADNENIRIWCADPIQAETLRQEYGEALQPLYTAPPPNEQGEPVAFCEDAALSLAERTFSAEVDEQLAEDIIQYALRLHTLYTAPQPAEQHPAPDVAALVEALERVMYCNEVKFLPEGVQQAVSDALAAHRKQGDQP